MVKHDDDRSPAEREIERQEERIYLYCKSKDNNVTQLEKLMSTLEEMMTKCRKPKGLKEAYHYIHKAFIYASYHLSIHHIKLFFKFYKNLYNELTINGLPLAADYCSDLMDLDLAGKREDHQRIQYFFHAIKLLDSCPFPYDIDERILVALQKLHKDDIADLKNAVKNIEAYNAYMKILDKLALSGTSQPSTVAITQISTSMFTKPSLEKGLNKDDAKEAIQFSLR